MAALLQDGTRSLDWIDGYLVSTLIAPVWVQPSHWAPELFPQIFDELEPGALTSLADLVLRRANQLSELVSTPEGLLEAFEAKDPLGICDWVKGFQSARQQFNAHWPRQSMTEDGHALLRRLDKSDAQPLTEKEITRLALWVPLRQALSVQAGDR